MGGQGGSDSSQPCGRFGSESPRREVPEVGEVCGGPMCDRRRWARGGGHPLRAWVRRTRGRWQRALWTSSICDSSGRQLQQLEGRRRLPQALPPLAPSLAQPRGNDFGNFVRVHGQRRETWTQHPERSPLVHRLSLLGSTLPHACRWLLQHSGTMLQRGRPAQRPEPRPWKPTRRGQEL